MVLHEHEFVMLIITDTNYHICVWLARYE